MENLNEQIIWSQRKNFLKNFQKIKKKTSKVAKTRIDNFY